MELDRLRASSIMKQRLGQRERERERVGSGIRKIWSTYNQKNIEVDTLKCKFDDEMVLEMRTR